MAINIGIVCEGSHDYNVLSKFITTIFLEKYNREFTIECLQPQVAATFQKTEGGWTQVKAWCQRQEGQGYRAYFDKPLFATSKAYDIIIIHLDGDVVEHCNASPLTDLNIDTLSVTEIIAAVKDAILNHWLDIDVAHDGRVLACIPVRHLEAWLSSGMGLHLKPFEDEPIKDRFRKTPIRKQKGSWRERYIKAAAAACTDLDAVRSECESFRDFEDNLSNSIAACGSA